MGFGKNGYSEKVDEAVYGHATDGFEAKDWALLALAALDQAGMGGEAWEKIREAVEAFAGEKVWK